MTTTSGHHPTLLEPRFLRLLQQLSLRLQGKVRGTTRRGQRRSHRRGTGGDFLDVRPYSPGDDLRHLDWHLYARLDALLVRIYEEPQEHTLHLLLDASASMGHQRGLFAKRLIASLAYLGLINADRINLVTLGDKVTSQIGPLRGRTSAHKIFHFLDRLEFTGQGDLHRALENFARVRRRGTIILLSDFLLPQGHTQALAQLARTGCKGAVLHLLSPEERMPPLGDDHTFIDAETNEQLVVHVDKKTRDAYLSQLAALEQELRDTCRRYGFPFVPLTSDSPLDEVLMGPLRAQGLVGA